MPKKTPRTDPPPVSPAATHVNGFVITKELDDAALKEEFRKLNQDRVHQPAFGRFVMVREFVEGDDRVRPEQLALTWEYPDPRRGTSPMISPTYDGLLLYENLRGIATWLPDEWDISMTPINWTWEHLKAWFKYAINTAKFNVDHGHFEEGSPNAPSSRLLIKHAIFIFRHLRRSQGLEGLPTQEPVEEITPQGYVTLLENYLDKLEQVMGLRRQRKEKNKGGRKVVYRNLERDKWIAEQRAKKNPPTWEEIHEELDVHAATKGWNPIGTWKGVWQAHNRYLRHLRMST
jgi:hypothetical protein